MLPQRGLQSTFGGDRDGVKPNDGINSRNKSGDQATKPPSQSSPTPSIPSISLPKGGGSIGGMGEKFDVNPSTGTASVSFTIATSPSRADFSPNLSLSYDSGSGNGPFGLGWSLSTASIARKTQKGAFCCGFG
jgi:hypothetical protein